MVGLISNYNQIASDLPASIRRLSEQPQVKREIDYFRSNIGKIKSADEFIADARIYNFAIKAFGLEDMGYAKAFIRKVLKEGVDSPDAFSVRLADQRFREFATVFNFKRYGTATTAFDRTQQGTVDLYLRNTLEQNSSESSEGLRLALYFERKAAAITSPYGILADRALYTVVRTALGLPQAMSGADIEKQAAVLSSKLASVDFTKPDSLKKFITRFLARYEIENGGPSSSTASPALAVFGGSTAGVDLTTLQSIQNLRRFGR